MKVVLIACIAANGVIGKNGKLAWNVPAEMQHFLEKVGSSQVICGRTTGMKLPNSFLKNRCVVEISRYNTKIMDLKDALLYCERNNKYPNVAYIIGGAKTYDNALAEGVVDEMVLSYLPDEYSGDCYFPQVNWNEWQPVSEIQKDGFIVKTYTKK